MNVSNTLFYNFVLFYSSLQVCHSFPKFTKHIHNLVGGRDILENESTAHLSPLKFDLLFL